MLKTTCNRLGRTRDWKCPTERVLRLYGRVAREAVHPTTSSSTGLRLHQSYCLICLSARNRALVTTWKDYGGQSRCRWTQEIGEDDKYLGHAIYARQSTLREVYAEDAAYLGGHRAEMIAASLNIDPRGVQGARPYLSTTDWQDRYDGDGPPV